ncbi:MAG: cysteine-rich CWC family protein [Rhodocyclales bacterium]|nr:cysteine-rich CWC family protein [Rhodocyclales bacterium]
MNRGSEFQGGSTCPRCGAKFVCGLLAGAKKCWCAELPHLPPPDPERKACYCPACLKALSRPRAK